MSRIMETKVMSGWVPPGLFLSFLITPLPALADVVTFRQGENGYTSGVDTFIRTEGGGREEWNMGGADVIQIQSSGEPRPNKQGLIKYDNIFGPGPGQVPSGQAITSATLRLYYYHEEIPTGQPKTLFVYPFLIDVPNYGTSDATVQTGEVTWKQRQYNVPGAGWGAAGTEMVNGPVAGED